MYSTKHIRTAALPGVRKGLLAQRKTVQPVLLLHQQSPKSSAGWSLLTRYSQAMVADDSYIITCSSTPTIAGSATECQQYQTCSFSLRRDIMHAPMISLPATESHGALSFASREPTTSPDLCHHAGPGLIKEETRTRNVVLLGTDSIHTEASKIVDWHLTYYISRATLANNPSSADPP